MKPVWSLLLLLCLSACSPNQDPEVLTLGGPFEFTSQDPARDGFLYTRLQVAESLLEVDDGGRLLPGLAHDWEVSEDGLIWRFRLRENVRFHDGRPLDADAVVNALEMARRKPGVLRTAPIAEIRAEDPLAVAVRLARPYNPLGALLAHYSTVILSPASYRDDANVGWMHGTGPYRLEAFDPPHRIRVARFDDYWGMPALIPKAVYLTGHRAESRALQVMAGQTDIVYTLDPASLDLLRRQKDVRVHSERIPRTIQIKLNAGHPFLAERDARLAMSLALDRQGIASRIVRVPGAEANQLIPPALAGWHLEELPPIRRDLERARQLLAGLGWQPGPDGILQRAGRRFQLTLATYADRPELSVVATAFQAQLREIGIAVAVNIVNSSGIPATHHDGSLELALVARNYGNVADPLSLLFADYGDGGNGDWGAMGWRNDELPALLQRLESERDPARYRTHARRISHILAEELPVIPVLFYTQQTAVSTRVQGFGFDPYERNYRISQMSLAAP
ncbi:ABC transporter substrate-binding protein [Azotobacter chroococcum]|uniref:Bacterial extracellular solute-binding protein, family 5 n=1 Tax=Azotobacter chroococcum NCIMB 8003 TaxID=1328314 RepID=A0A0C4WKS3_9GAMM|nr:ABC transporter substrate-binding protein [Azotobacter chroococcum]AJE23433.1 Bacterial extracellular solute-binding protein, family 5 [Azotobacter chroococcum NCIMB 8003]